VTRALLLAVLALCVVTGCSGSAGADREPSFPDNPDHQRLIATARLEPCPTTSGGAVSGGLPDVTLTCLGDGPAVRLAALRGTPTVVNLWGSWCGPCQKETPFLQRAHARLGDAVRFLGVDTEDSSDSALDFAAHVNPPMRYPSVVDDDKAVLVGLHGPSAVPMTVFVDANGRVVHLEPHPYGSVTDLLADIDRYLGVHA
jgi:cytochrome c biogenesis protein CcmG, thiol:disulfide interchange protein DsbE